MKPRSFFFNLLIRRPRLSSYACLITMLRAVLVVAALGAVAAGPDGRAPGRAPTLRIRGGGLADVGRAQAPLKRANAFKIAVRIFRHCREQTRLLHAIGASLIAVAASNLRAPQISARLDEVPRLLPEGTDVTWGDGERIRPGINGTQESRIRQFRGLASRISRPALLLALPTLGVGGSQCARRPNARVQSSGTAMQAFENVNLSRRRISGRGKLCFFSMLTRPGSRVDTVPWRAHPLYPREERLSDQVHSPGPAALGVAVLPPRLDIVPGSELRPHVHRGCLAKASTSRPSPPPTRRSKHHMSPKLSPRSTRRSGTRRTGSLGMTHS